MSVEIQACVWRSALSGAQMLLMQAIADCADDDGFAYPSVRHLVWKTGLSRSGVQKILAFFREAGYLNGTPVETGDASTRYRIMVINLPEKTPWRTIKGRVSGQSGREYTLPTTLAGSSPPRPPRAVTLPTRSARNKEETSRNIIKSGDQNCEIHPNSGLTQWGSCWGCYAAKHSAATQA